MDHGDRAESVLVVDDEPHILTAVADLLEDDFDVITAENAEQALQVLSEHQVAVILSDQRMPGIPGDEFLREARERSAAARIMLTGYADMEAVGRAINEGQIYAFVMKPWEPESLRTTVCRAADHCHLVQRLTEEQDLLRSLMQNIPDAVFFKDRDMRFTRLNGPAAYALGVTNPERCVGKRADELLPSVESAVMCAEDSAILETGVPVIGKLTRAIGGATCDAWWSTTKVPIRSFAGEITGLVGIARDVTEQQQQQDQLALLSELARLVGERLELESAIETAIQVLSANFPAQQIAVYECEDPGRPEAFMLLAATGDAPIANTRRRVVVADRRYHDRAPQTMARYTADTRATSDATVRLLLGDEVGSAVLVPMSADGKPCGVLAVGRDSPSAFTDSDVRFLERVALHIAGAIRNGRLYRELQHTCEELRQTQQAVLQQERLRALGEMASGIAHDINNTLSPIVGYSQLLLETEMHLSEQGRHRLNTMLTAGHDIAQTDARMREFYRQREDRQPLVLIDLNSAVRQAVDMTKPRWRDIPLASGISISVDTRMSEGLPLLWGVESEVRQALVNVIVNAVDAMPEGGNIVVTTYRCTDETAQDAARSYPVADRGANEYAVVEISDGGVGMDEETRCRCLEPFYSTKGDKGTGLGLAMVYGVMRRHSGEVRIRSKEGEGTAISLLFPSASVTEEPIEAGPANAPTKLRILYIDDDPVIRELAGDMLEHDGHLVETVEGGASGVRSFAEAADHGEPFDLVITDLGMPDVDGRDVARAIKHHSPTVPVIMMTGWGDLMGDRDHVPEYVDILLSKPPQLLQLRQVFVNLFGATGTNLDLRRRMGAGEAGIPAA